MPTHPRKLSRTFCQAEPGCRVQPYNAWISLWNAVAISQFHRWGCLALPRQVTNPHLHLPKLVCSCDNSRVSSGMHISCDLTMLLHIDCDRTKTSSIMSFTNSKALVSPFQRGSQDSYDSRRESHYEIEYIDQTSSFRRPKSLLRSSTAASRQT